MQLVSGAAFPHAAWQRRRALARLTGRGVEGRGFPPASKRAFESRSAQILGLRVALALGLGSGRVVVGNPEWENNLVNSELKWRWAPSPPGVTRARVQNGREGWVLRRAGP